MVIRFFEKKTMWGYQEKNLSQMLKIFLNFLKPSEKIFGLELRKKFLVLLLYVIYN